MNRKIAFTISLAAISIAAHSKILRVNNTGIATATPPNAEVIYTTAQTAYDAANPGDTLHIEPSGTSYGNLSISKKIVVIGNGYYLGSLSTNANPGLQTNEGNSRINALNISTGADGSVVMGLYLMNTSTIAGSNVVISRNYFTTQVTIANCSNIQITQCIIGSLYSYYNGNGANLTIANNIIYNCYFDDGDNGIAVNNIIQANSSFSSFTLKNNIHTAGNLDLTNCTVENNVSFNGKFGSTNGNITIADMNTVFEDYANTDPLFSEDSRFQIKAGSLAKTSGTGGGECGIFGNQYGTAYKLSGIPNVPSVYKLSAPLNTSGPTMDATISIRSNQ